MADESLDIRNILIGRIREIRDLQSRTLSSEASRTLANLELFNVQLYYFIFKTRI